MQTVGRLELEGVLVVSELLFTKHYAISFSFENFFSLLRWWA